MKFETAEKMLDYINQGHDLYSRTAEIYVFGYNDVGSICTYSIDESEASRLSKQAKYFDESSWSDFLTIGGTIWDDPSHECYHEWQSTNLDCCVELIIYDDWMLTEDFLNSPVK